MNKKEAIGTYIKFSLYKKEKYYLENSNLFNEAIAFLHENNLFEEAREKLGELKSEMSDKAFKACLKLFEIFKSLNIWILNKNSKEIIELCEIIKENDVHYCAREFLFKELTKLPKFSKLNENDKLLLALKIGALDYSDLT